VLAAVEKVGGEALITADHGNVEEMFDEESGQPNTQHSTLPVPFIFYSSRKATMVQDGSLADVAPTMLHLMGIPQPAEMTGKNLINLSE
jgi:2,3-bisphosphoglycerate-independent phosphoglycerate mutase